VPPLKPRSQLAAARLLSAWGEGIGGFIPARSPFLGPPGEPWTFLYRISQPGRVQSISGRGLSRDFSKEKTTPLFTTSPFFPQGAPPQEKASLDIFFLKGGKEKNDRYLAEKTILLFLPTLILRGGQKKLPRWGASPSSQQKRISPSGAGDSFLPVVYS